MTGDLPTPFTASAPAAMPSPDLRHRLDAAVLAVLRTGSARAMRELAEACDALGHATAPTGRALWRLAQAAWAAEAHRADAALASTTPPALTVLAPDAPLRRMALPLTLLARSANVPSTAPTAPTAPTAKASPALVHGLLTSALRGDGPARGAGDGAGPCDDASDFLAEADAASLELVQALTALGGGGRPGDVESDTVLDRARDTALDAARDAALSAAQTLLQVCALAGLPELSRLADALWRALLWTRHADAAGLMVQQDAAGPALQAAAEELRAMLHRHAAGFDRPPAAAALQGLHALLDEAYGQLGLPR